MPDGPSQRPEDVRFISGAILVSRQGTRAEGHDLVASWSGHLRTAPETGLS
jgi:hypothetical protein